MMDYYLSRCEEIRSDNINGHSNDMGYSNLVDEVEEDKSGSAQFMVQNEVSNAIDSSMVQNGGAVASHSSIVL